MWTTRAVIVALLAAATLTSTGHAVSTPTAGLLDDNALAAVERSVPGFAGTWVDGGTLVVASTRGTGALAGQARHELARLLGRPDFASLPVAVRPARYTFGELTGWHDAVSHAVLGLPGTVFTDADERGNVVRVGVEDVARQAAAITEIAATNGVPAEALVIEHADPVRTTADPIQEVTDLSTPFLPAAGGQEIAFATLDNVLGYLCTLGFPGINGANTGFMTASHCSAAQGSVDSTLHRLTGLGPPIGIEVADPPLFTGGACPVGRLCRYSDAAFSTLVVPQIYNRGHLAHPRLDSRQWDGLWTFRVAAEESTILGETLTKVGRTTGRTVGVVTGTCMNFNVSSTNITMLCQHQVNLFNGGGDSGSPVFRIFAGDDVATKGLLWGQTSGGAAVFSPIANIESELGPVATCAPEFGC